MHYLYVDRPVVILDSQYLSNRSLVGKVGKIVSVCGHQVVVKIRGRNGRLWGLFQDMIKNVPKKERNKKC